MDGLGRGKFKYFICLITGIISGILIGMISINALIGYRVDQYHYQIKYLNSIIDDKDVKLKKLEETINKNKFIIKDIKVILMYDGDDLDKLTLKEHIIEKYDNLLGKEVKDVDIELISGIIDNRIMKIDNAQYKLKVNRIFLTEELILWIEIREME